MAKDVLFRHSSHNNRNSSGNRNNSERTARPVANTVRAGAAPPVLRTPAAHAEAAQAHSRMAAHHAGEAARMARDEARERPRRGR